MNKLGKLNSNIKDFLEQWWFLKRQKRHLIFNHTKWWIVVVSWSSSDGNFFKNVRKDFLNENLRLNIK